MPDLTPAQARAWQALWRIAGTLPGALDYQLRWDSGLSHFEYRILETLSTGTQPLSALAASTAATISRLSHVISGLERDGFVRRTRVSGSRSKEGSITPKGRAKLAEASRGYTKTLRAMVFDSLSAEQVHALTTACEAFDNAALTRHLEETR